VAHKVRKEPRRVASLPRVLLQSYRGWQEYAVLLTDEGSIFVRSGRGPAAVGMLLGTLVGVVAVFALNDTRSVLWLGWLLLCGGIGASLSGTLGARRRVDLARGSPADLAAPKDSITVTHDRIRSIQIVKRGWGYRLHLAFQGSRGNEITLVAAVLPPVEYIRQRRAVGMPRAEIFREYGVKVRQAFERALPPEAARERRWEV